MLFALMQTMQTSSRGMWKVQVCVHPTQTRHEQTWEMNEGSKIYKRFYGRMSESKQEGRMARCSVWETDFLLSFLFIS